MLPLAPTRAVVEQYADDAQLGERFDGFEVVDVTTDGERVTVTMRAESECPSST